MTTFKTEWVLRELRRHVGEPNLLTGDAAAPYALGAFTPLAAAFPRDREAAQEVVNLALEHEFTVLPWGGGTDLAPSLQPATVMLGTQRLNRLIDYQPDDLTVTVEAGMTVATLAGMLAQRGQILPLDPPLPDRATLGGMIAGNTAGPSRCAYGTPRDWLIGIQVIGGEGAIIKGGGRVVKNVAGYDLCKLYSGSRGTLGAICELSFKLYPRPESTGTLLVALDSAARAEQLLGHIVTAELAPTAVELLNSAASQRLPDAPLPPESYLALAVRFDGAREAVAWQLDELGRGMSEVGADPVVVVPERRCEPVWAMLRDPPAQGADMALKAAIPSAGVAAYVAAAQTEAEQHEIGLEINAHALNGIVHLRVHTPPGTRERRIPLLESLRERATALGGSLIVRQSEPLSPELVWGPPRADWPLMRGIKQALDPKGVFNPGGFVGGL
jgi:glycolate dehydrogenase FAD-binding subunit